jgi:hypothetical protein
MALPAHCDDPFEFIVDDDLLFSEPLLELPHLNSHEDRSALSRGTVPALASNELSTMTETSINRGMPSVGSEAPLFEPDIALLQSEGLSVEVEMPFIDTELDTLQHAQPSEADNKLNETRWKDTEINLLLQEQHHIHQQHQELPPVSNPLQSAQQVALREQNYWAQGKEPGHCTYSSTDLRDMMNIAGQSQLVFVRSLHQPLPSY